MSQEHTFHIPVMGTGFTNETPMAVAPYGLTTVVSLVNDTLVELLRRKHCLLTGREYQPIDDEEPDVRARRMKAYLNLVDELVAENTQRVREGDFRDPKGPGRFFELLPDGAPSKQRFEELTEDGVPVSAEADAELRKLIVPGRIDANIMTKLDGAKDRRGDPVPDKHSEALLAFRGFAESTIKGGMVFSAGANPRLFAYMAEFDAFYPKADGTLDKTIILKVSDFRSALVQGKMLARRGLWVSEFRIESGLNCGGHAFPTEGILLGPILDEFRKRRGELQALQDAWKKSLANANRPVPEAAPTVRVTVQGGIGTRAEDVMVRELFEMDGTGWGTPFLRVREAVELDEATDRALGAATDETVKLSWSSPLGVRFWTITTSGSEVVKRERTESGHSGNVCTKRHLALTEEYGKVPLCRASRAYQKRKLGELDSESPHFEMLRDRVCAPACICEELGGAPLRRAGEMELLPEKYAPPAQAICPGPNLVNFTRAMTLEELIGHIYGRVDLLGSARRPHMFVREAELYLDILDEEFSQLGTPLETRSQKQLAKFIENLEAGISFYEEMAEQVAEGRTRFRSDLMGLKLRVGTQKRRLEAFAA